MTGAALRDAIAWALVHLLWQSALVAAWLRLVLELVPRRFARVRHGAALVACIVVVIAPIATALVTLRGWRAASVVGGGASVIGAAREAPRLVALQEALQPWLPWLLAAWLGGVAWNLWTLRRDATRATRLARTAAPASPRVAERFRAIARRLEIRRAVAVRTHPAATVPMLIRAPLPLVLLPPDLEHVVSDAQLEAICAHELAHVKRRDDLINLWHCAVEACCPHLPAMRFIGRALRRERECCCDQLAVRVSANAPGYARALAALESTRRTALRPALAFADGPLVDRVTRILGAPSPRPSWRVVVALLLPCLAAAPFARDVQRHGWAPAPLFGGPILISGQDPAGRFTVALERGRVRGASVDGVPVPPSRLIQTRDSLRVVDDRGALVLAIAVARAGAISWAPRAPKPRS